MAGARELLRGSQAGRAGTDDGDGCAELLLRRLRLNPAFLPGALDDFELDLFDRHRVIIDAEHASGFAWGGTEAACELREVVRGVEAFDGFAPPVFVHEVV